jgi:hypothetical protein
MNGWEFDGGKPTGEADVQRKIERLQRTQVAPAATSPAIPR